MNISRKWLKEFVDITATDKEYDEIMTIAGQKVETTTRMDEDIKNVVREALRQIDRAAIEAHARHTANDGVGEMLVSSAQFLHAAYLL